MKPDWKTAPEWAQWLAMDADGGWRWYAIEPIKLGCAWMSSKSKEATHPALRDPGDYDWRYTLEPRNQIDTPS